MKIKYGHSFYFGGNLSIALSPKITLDMGAEQRYQLEQKINGNKNSNVRSIPTYSIGSTYSINEDTAISFSADLGGSSRRRDAPRRKAGCGAATGPRPRSRQCSFAAKAS